MNIVLKIKKRKWFEEQFCLNETAFGDKKKFHISTCEKAEYQNEFSCYWCHIIQKETTPIHCPLKNFSTQIEKKFLSKNGSGFYVIKGYVDNIVEECEIKKINNEYYVVDGNFCSASCCLAFIQDKESNPIYSDSIMLLYKMTQLEDISPSPHWKTRKIYGGFLTDEEYISCVKNKEKHVYCNEIIFMNHIFEKKLFLTN